MEFEQGAAVDIYLSYLQIVIIQSPVVIYVAKTSSSCYFGCVFLKNKNNLLETDTEKAGKSYSILF